MLRRYKGNLGKIFGRSSENFDKISEKSVDRPYEDFEKI